MNAILSLGLMRGLGLGLLGLLGVIGAMILIGPALLEAPHFSESTRSTAEPYPPMRFESHVGWRATPARSDSVNVEGAYAERRTLAPEAPGGSTIYFFGGSAMWGVGMADESTIPSLVAQELGGTARNFAAPGYTAHQSLQMLMWLVQSGLRPDIVVFLDGLDDVGAKCRVGRGVFSIAFEADTRERLAPRIGSPEYFLYPFVAAWRRLTAADRAAFDCTTDDGKARAIARGLITDWSIARAIAADRGIRFAAFVQPPAGRTRIPVQEVAAVYRHLVPGAAAAQMGSLAGLPDGDSRAIARAIAASLR